MFVNSEYKNKEFYCQFGLTYWNICQEKYSNVKYSLKTLHILTLIILPLILSYAYSQFNISSFYPNFHKNEGNILLLKFVVFRNKKRTMLHSKMWGCVLEEFQECHDESWQVLSSCSPGIYCKNIRLRLWSGGLIGWHKNLEWPANLWSSGPALS